MFKQQLRFYIRRNQTKKCTETLRLKNIIQNTRISWECFVCKTINLSQASTFSQYVYLCQNGWTSNLKPEGNTENIRRNSDTTNPSADARSWKPSKRQEKEEEEEGAICTRCGSRGRSPWGASSRPLRDPCWANRGCEGGGARGSGGERQRSARRPKREGGSRSRLLQERESGLRVRVLVGQVRVHRQKIKDIFSFFISLSFSFSFFWHLTCLAKPIRVLHTTAVGLRGPWTNSPQEDKVEVQGKIYKL
jgi:hypothetical protein